ncbi:restriction endonuclease subunit S [Dolichospermum planctonicum CS-1226]|uniref:Restriction endonuclease subunit S n=1 Tax=Dolichospermum planctonicum CS-1226 TaxID=3021751 RepID=A0ABT5AHK6_9CYAN|nr:restriction endonuclease subunit S [Dolichospermum planctonicum]MDB9536761.1 restriction endonuclease subunit S [Dolichospermum planctonicum CS-1226]
MVIHWKTDTLGNIPIKFIDGDRSSKYPKREEFVSEGIPFLNGESINENYVNLSKVNFITEEKFLSITKGRLQKGDLILTTRGNGVGQAALFNKTSQDALINAQLLILRPDKSHIDPAFLYYSFITPFFKSNLKNFVSGSAQPQLPIKSLRNIKFSYPPLITQCKISEILSKYDNLIDNNNRRIALLEESIHLLYKDWFVRLRFPGYESVKVVDGIPDGWEISSIGNLSDLITRGITPKYDLESPKIVINQKCIRNYHINFDFARQHLSDVPEQKKIKFGDVLINSTGMGTLGRVAQVLTNFENVTVDTHITIVRPKIELEKHFFGVSLEYLQNYLDTLGEGATGQTELKRQILSAVPILVPNKNIRHQFDQKVLSSRILVQKLLDQNQKLKEARDLLLPRLMSGKITV